MRRTPFFLLFLTAFWIASCAPRSPVAPVEKSERVGTPPAADTTFRADQWIPSWTALGPFAAPGENGLKGDRLTAIGGEKRFLTGGEMRDDFAPLLAATPNLQLKTLAPDSRGLVDFNEAFGDGTELSNTVAYAWTDLVCAESGYALLRVGSDDGVQVRINGRLVVDHPTRRAAAPDQEVVGVRLQEGDNRCLVKVDQGTGGWGFYLRFSSLVPEEPGVHIRMLKSPEPPLILLGAEKPINQTLHVSLLHNGTEPAEDFRLRLRSPDLQDALSEAFALEPGDASVASLELKPSPHLKPGRAVSLSLEVVRNDGSTESLGSVRTKTALVHPLLRPRPSPDSSEPFYIVQLSDTHIERNDSVLLGVRTAERLEQAVADINALDPPPAFAVVTGDFTHNSMNAYPVYFKIMSKLKVPFLTVFGNHDKPQGLPPAARAFSEWGQPEYYSFEYNEIPFFILDSVAEANPPYGVIPSPQLQWIETVLRDTSRTPRVFFLHHDLFSGRGVENYKDVLRVIEDHPGPSWFFTGHWHGDTFVRQGDQHHVITGSTGYLFPMETLTQDHGVPGYRIIRFEDGRVATEFKELGGDILADPAPNDYWTPAQVMEALEEASP